MTSLTEQQQELVARNLFIVHWVICDYIHVNPTICGMEYGDLFQEGCLWLCKAASTYKNDGRAQFSTYAKTVVKNGLLSYCRAICNRKKKFSRLIIGEHGELAADGEALESRPDAFDTLYQVPPSHVGAWISRSTAKLRRDSKFLKSLL